MAKAAPTKQQVKQAEMARLMNAKATGKQQTTKSSGSKGK
jgi:hypothetical protein